MELPAATDPSPSACGSPNGPWNPERGAKWIVGNYGNTLYNHFYAPNAAAWDCMNATQQKGLLAARSLHPGSVSVLLCDGAVRVVVNSVDLGTWHALATRSGEELSAVE